MAKKEKKSGAKNSRSLAQSVRAGRDAAGLTQMALAMAAGVSLATLTKIEAGDSPDPHWLTVVRLARALDADLQKWGAAAELE